MTLIEQVHIHISIHDPIALHAQQGSTRGSLALWLTWASTEEFAKAIPLKPQYLFPCLIIPLLTLLGCTNEVGYSQRAQTLFEYPEPLPTITSYEGRSMRWIERVFPDPGATLILSSPEDWSSRAMGVGDVCALVYEEPLLRPGDDWRYLENWQIRIDGEMIPVEAGKIHQEVVDLEVVIRDEEGNPIASGAKEDTKCALGATREPGLHLAELTVWTSTGEEFTYSWAFKVEP